MALATPKGRRNPDPAGLLAYVTQQSCSSDATTVPSLAADHSPAGIDRYGPMMGHIPHCPGSVKRARVRRCAEGTGTPDQDFCQLLAVCSAGTSGDEGSERG